MTSITVYGGANEIGGNKILVEDKDTRIFLDFGEPFGMKDKFFVDFLTPREGRFGLRDYFHFDMLPKIPGLYDANWLCGTELRYSPPEFDAFFISHMHYDHTMHLKYADSKIPVHLGAAANTIRRSWIETSLGKTDFGDHRFNEFRTGQKIRVGGMEVEPIHVDHSTPGAYGFIVHTTSGCIAYTGDLRVHGPRSDMTREFVRRASLEKPDVLVCEGTRMDPSDPREDLSERDVQQKAQKLIASSKRLSIVSFYPKDVDRMRTFRDVAKATGRRFVVSAKVANLLEAFQGDKKIDVPDPLRDPSMLIYVRRMARPEKVRYENEYVKMLGSSDHVVDSDFVKIHQRELIFHTDFFQLGELIDIKPEPGSLFIRSKSEPFEEDDVQEEVLKNWVDWFKLEFHQAHASGHANMRDIFAMIEEISPRLVIPVHTQHATEFLRCNSKVECPEARRRTKVC